MRWPDSEVIGGAYAHRDQSLVPVATHADILRRLVCRGGIERRHATGQME